MKWRASLPLSSFIALIRLIADCHIRSNERRSQTSQIEVRWRCRRMDKRKAKIYRDKLMVRREGLVGQVQAAEAYSRERDAEATQDPADMAANAYTKELMMSMSTNDRQLLDSIDAALER